MKGLLPNSVCGASTSSEGLRSMLVCPFVAQMGGDGRRGQAADALPGHIAEFGNSP